MERSGVRALAACLMLVSVACGGGDGKTPTPPQGVITVAIAPTSATVMQGETTTLTVALGRANYSGSIDLSVEGLPSGATATFTPASVPNGTNTSTLVIAVAANGTVGPAALLLRARGTGVAEATTAVGVSVTARPLALAVTVSVSATSIQQGETGAAIPVRIQRTNFTGPVSLAASGLPTGLSASFANSPTSDSVATMTLTAVASVATGTYPLTVTGTAPGVSAATSPLSVTVTPAPIALFFCKTVPTWFAVQEAFGAWRVVPHAGNGRFVFDFNANYGGYAYVVTDQATGAATIQFQFRLASELRAASNSACTAPTQTRTVNLAVSPRLPGETANIQYGFSGYIPLSSIFTSGSTSAVRTGAHDVVALKTATALANRRAIVRRQQNIPDGGTLNLDFGAAEALAPQAATATLSSGSSSASILSGFLTNTGFGWVPFGDGFNTSGNTWSWAAVPQSLAVPGDLWVVEASLGDANGDFRIADYFLNTPRHVNADLGSAMSPSTLSFVSLAPYPRMRVAVVRTTDYPGSFFLNMQQSSTPKRNLFVNWSAAYWGGPGPLDFTVPDFSGLPGWNNSWALRVGAPVSVNAFGESVRVLPFDGYIERLAGRSLFLTP
jgi:hypothetical protein